MATLTSSFSGSFAMDLAASAARGPLSDVDALSIATSAYTRAEILKFAAYAARTPTLVSGSYANGDAATFAGSNLLALPSSIQRLDYQFAEGAAVRLTGAWGRYDAQGAFHGDVDRGDVTFGGARVSFLGVRLPPGNVWVAFPGFDGSPAVGNGLLGAVAYSRDGASLTLRGSLQGRTWADDAGQLHSAIEGTVTSITLAYGASTFSLAGIKLAYADVVNASVSSILGLALTGDDILTGAASNEMLEGFGGNDSISSGAGFDTLAGHEGNDTLNGGADSDTLIGGAGHDTYWLDRSTDLVAEDPDGGTDLVLLAFSASGSDTLAANVENGTIVGRAGVLVSLTGNALANRLTGSAYADTLDGGSGTDTMTGGLGNDVYGVDEEGDVVVEAAAAGFDTIRTTLSAFTLSGRANVEGLEYAGSGDFAGTGSSGNDRLAGGAGADTLDGGTGSDTLVGGGGDDVYAVNAATDVVVETAGGGLDTVNVSFATGAYTLGVNVENAFVLVPGAVQLTGNALDNFLSVGAGASRLVGGGGNDTLAGGPGSDTLDGGAGVDVAVLEGALSDYRVVRTSATQTNLVHVSAGYTVSLLGIESVQWKADSGTTTIEALNRGLGTPGNDLLVGGFDDDTLVGGAGADTLSGGGLWDLLQGGTGGDTYHFGVMGGHDFIQENDATPGVIDTLVVDAGAGSLAGGEVRLTRNSYRPDELELSIISPAGGGFWFLDWITVEGFFDGDAVSRSAAIEQIRFADGNITLSQAQILGELLKGTAEGDWIRGYNGNEVINGREGDDTIAGADGNDTLIGNWGDDRLSGEAGADLLQGNLGMDTLVGGAGNDILEGGAAGDALAGDAGSDVLLGGAGNDQLDGGAGLDTLTGGMGDDTLAGGADADRFVLNSPTGTDTITDFVSGVDKIAINKSVFSAVTAPVGTTPRTAEALGPAFAYDAESGQLTYDADGAGGADPTVIAQFNAGQALAADFLVIG